MAIDNAILLATDTTVFTAGNTSAVTVIYFMNDDGSPRDIDINIVPSGDAVATQNQVYKTVTINAGDTFILDTEKIILDAGDFISAKASLTGVISVTVSSVEI